MDVWGCSDVKNQFYWDIVYINFKKSDFKNTI